VGSCAHYLEDHPGNDGAFTVDASRITFGAAIDELGGRARSWGMTRVALFSDPNVSRIDVFARARRSLEATGIDVVPYSECVVEPTDLSLETARRFAAETRPDGFVSVGGGSVIDTCKAANLYATHPADLLTYVNAPIGTGRPIPGRLRPHIACPTTCGTGSEVTGIAVFDLLEMGAKTGISSPLLRPSEALIDPSALSTLPTEVVAASGLDVLSHALESFTARKFNRRSKPADPLKRPLSQGANPWSDVGCREALALAGTFLERAVSDATDFEARTELMWAATLAGIAFGNAGVHLPHGMSYAVAGLVKDYVPSGYGTKAPLVPHGMSVILNAPSVFRVTAASSPDRHLEAARLLGADTRGASEADAGEVLASALERIMRAVHMPNGIGGVGYGDEDVDALAERAFRQKRLVDNAPIAIDESGIRDLFVRALQYW
jgi:hydroxyacid-oxoacid transhydrogenase